MRLLMAIAMLSYACGAPGKRSEAAIAQERAELTDWLLAEPACKSANAECVAKPDACDLRVLEQLEAYACGSWKKRVSCLDAIEKAPTPLSDRQIYVVRQYYLNQKGDAVCYHTSPLLDGAFRTSIWHTERKNGIGTFEQAIQVAPTVTLGIPFGINGDGNAAKAIGNGGTVAGLNIRYTPLSFLASVNAFIGTMDADATSLDPERFPNPRFVVIGGGVDTIAGILGFSVVNARLRGNGLFGENRDSTWFMQVTIDLAAVTTTVAGAASSGKTD